VTTDGSVAKGFMGHTSHHVIASGTKTGGGQLVELSPQLKSNLLAGIDIFSPSNVFVIDTSLAGTSIESLDFVELTGDSFTDMVVILKDDAGNRAAYVYPGADLVGSAMADDLFAQVKLPVSGGFAGGGTAIPGVTFTTLDSDNDCFDDVISITDENGGVHYFPKDGLTWPTAVYSDPNIDTGSSTTAPIAHDHQDAGGVVESADLDGDGCARPAHPALRACATHAFELRVCAGLRTSSRATSCCFPALPPTRATTRRRRRSTTTTGPRHLRRALVTTMEMATSISS
jgi:hypothetical protein